MAKRAKTKNYYAIAFVVIVALLIVGLILTTQRQAKPETKPEIFSSEVKTLPDGTKYIVHPKEILSGGPQKDGIPSIDNPRFETAGEADKWLIGEDYVLGLNYNGVVKAYPIRILNWHEIVNDFAGDKPVLVTYCPLCRSGLAFDAVVNGERFEFGTSGKLWNSDLVMYDRKTSSYWSQIQGKAIVGELSGMTLKMLSLELAKWNDWKRVHPNTLVLSREFECSRYNLFCKRDYTYNPYQSFESDPNSAGIGVNFVDRRLNAKAIIYGVVIGNTIKAYEENAVKEASLLNDVVANEPVLVLWDDSLSTVKIFNRTLDGERIDFAFDGAIKDSRGNAWSRETIESTLERIPTFGHYWFAWVAFYPQTDLYK